MSYFLSARWPAFLPALLALNVSAQTSGAAAPAAPSQLPPGQYRSALEGYQPYGENKPVPWRQANDTVGQVGGWRAYAKEAAGAQAPADPAPAASGAANPHAGHGKP